MPRLVRKPGISQRMVSGLHPLRPAVLPSPGMTSQRGGSARSAKRRAAEPILATPALTELPLRSSGGCAMPRMAYPPAPGVCPAGGRPQ